MASILNVVDGVGGFRVEIQKYHRCMSHCGFKLSERSFLVPTTSLGIRLIRYAPERMLSSCLADMALRLLRILPASEAVALPAKRGGGAKSRAVKVPEFLSRCLRDALVIILSEIHCLRWVRNLRAWHNRQIVERRSQWQMRWHQG